MSGMSSRPPPTPHSVKSGRRLRAGVLTVSDSRTLADDRSGDAIEERLLGAGHDVLWRGIVPDDTAAIRAAVALRLGWLEAVLVTGGTGIAPRDVTPEALEPLVTRALPGFGETFRAISFDEVGAHGLLSRAFAALANDTLIVALPGSTRACVTAMERLVLELLPHAADLAIPEGRPRSGHHGS